LSSKSFWLGCQGAGQDFSFNIHWPKDRKSRPKAENGVGQQIRPHQLGGWSAERCELFNKAIVDFRKRLTSKLLTLNCSYHGFRVESRTTEGFPLFSALRMISPDTEDYHAVIGRGQDPVPRPLLRMPCLMYAGWTNCDSRYARTKYFSTRFAVPFKLCCPPPQLVVISDPELVANLRVKKSPKFHADTANKAPNHRRPSGVRKIDRLEICGGGNFAKRTGVCVCVREREREREQKEETKTQRRYNILWIGS